MSALQRAQHDEEQGDLGMARRRLVSLAMSSHYDAELIERIARLSVRMGDLAEAGRWYFACDSRDDVAADCIARFLKSCGGRLEHAVTHIPLKRRLSNPDDLPTVVRERLDSSPAGVTVMQRIGLASAVEAQPAKMTGGELLMTFGCVGAMLAFIGLAVIGLVALIASIAGWW